MIGLGKFVDEDDEKELDRAVDDPWEEGGGEGIAIRTATLSVVGEEEPSSVIGIFVGSRLALVALPAEGNVVGRGWVYGVGFKNIRARMNKESAGETS